MTLNEFSSLKIGDIVQDPEKRIWKLAGVDRTGTKSTTCIKLERADGLYILIPYEQMKESFADWKIAPLLYYSLFEKLNRGNGVNGSN